jgi:hypothetical protein
MSRKQYVHSILKIIIDSNTKGTGISGLQDLSGAFAFSAPCQMEKAVLWKMEPSIP